MSLPSPTPPLAMRLNVWALSLASATSAVAVSILAWPLKLLMHHRAGYEMQVQQSTTPMMHHGGGLWHLGLLALVALWAGIGGAIVAAVYNAVVARQLR